MEVLFENKVNREYVSDEKLYNEEYIKMMNGDICFNEKSVGIFEKFERIGREIADEMKCVKKIYPLLLPVDTLEKTNYVAKFSHHCIFCDEVDEVKLINYKNNKETMDAYKVRDSFTKKSSYLLSPSACYHTYFDYENTSLKQNLSISFQQNVCRTEEKYMDNDFGRLRSYHIREFVYIGTKQFVKEALAKTEELIKNKLIELDLDFSIVRANDSFALPEERILEKLQLINDVKHEFRVSYSPQNDLAVGSVNYHEDTFTKPFNITLNGEKIVSGCVGLGLERLSVAYLRQFG